MGRFLRDEVRALFLEAPSRRGKAAIAPGKDTPTIVADDVAAWLHAQQDGQKKAITMIAREMFEGPLKMAPVPYQEVWVESNVSIEIGNGRSATVTMGEMVTTIDLSGGAQRVHVTGWSRSSEIPDVQWPECALVYVQRADGTIDLETAKAETENPVEGKVHWVVSPMPWADPPLVGFDHRIELAVVHASYAIAAFAFAICRNVPVETFHVPAKVAAKRAKKLGLSDTTTRYSRINLPGHQSWRSSAQAAAGAGSQEMPGHLVRAHPKTYQRREDGTGGLGKHHAEGTWLWSPQYRGNRNVGETVPHVVVKPTDTEAAGGQ